MKLAVCALVALSCLSSVGFAAGLISQTEQGSQSSKPMMMAAGGSCSSWKSTCEGRGGGANCTAKYNSCMKSGCFTEGEKYGGATHCGLSKN
jgi:hypothetical protein